MTSPTPVLIRVVLADDHVVVRAGIRQFLEQNGDIQVIAEAANGQEACDLVLQHRPDVAILDIQMPGLNGVEVLRQMKMLNPAVPVILSSAYQGFKRDLGTWASDEYVVKSGNLDDLKGTVRRLLKET